jgi:steroid delta-isomerase-like uncharacterized protein
MAEKENIQLAEQQVAALNARDLDGFLSRVDDSYIGHAETAPGPVRGRQGMRQYMETILRAFPDLHVEIEQILASGNTVVVRQRSTGTQKGNFAGIAPTNKSIVMESCNVLEIRDGKVAQSRMYSDTATLFQQLGVLSLPKVATAG